MAMSDPVTAKQGACPYLGLPDDPSSHFSDPPSIGRVDVGIDAMGALTGLSVIVRWVGRRQGPPRSR